MRVFAAVVVGAGAGLLAGAAAADPIPIPPIPTVTVTVPAPSVPLPLPTAIPQPSQPALPELAATAAATTATSSTQLAGAAGNTPTAAAASSSSPSSAFSPPSSPATPSSSFAQRDAAAARVDHFHSSRPWIGTTGSKRRRTTTLTFVLPQASRVVLTVNEVSPACIGVGHLTVSGRAGINRVRFAGVVHGRRLTPGTYRISIGTASGHVLRRVTLVVVGGSAPTQDELDSLRAANVCHAGVAPTTTPTVVAGQTAAPLVPGKLPQPQPAAASVVPTQAPDLHSGVLASRVAKTAAAIRPLLVALLALSILLLGAASLPPAAVPGPRMHYTLARHRLALAAVGAGALVAVAIAVLLG